MGHSLKIKCVDSRVNVHILTSTNVPFTFTTVQVPNLALTHRKRITVLEEDIVLEPVTVEPVNCRGNIGLKKDYEKFLALMVVVFSSNNFISFSYIILKQ
jgi:hypothetical protein